MLSVLRFFNTYKIYFNLSIDIISDASYIKGIENRENKGEDEMTESRYQIHENSVVPSTLHRVEKIYELLQNIHTDWSVLKTDKNLILLDNRQNVVFEYDRMRRKVGTTRNYVFVDCQIIGHIAVYKNIKEKDLRDLIYTRMREYAETSGMKKEGRMDHPAWLQFLMLQFLMLVLFDGYLNLLPGSL